MMNQLAVIDNQQNVEAYTASTNAAHLCREIVLKTSKRIGDRNYVSVEGWQAIAIAHGCACGSRDVERVEGGVRAIGEVRRMSDSTLIAVAEGFVGEDEPTWYGGEAEVWDKRAGHKIKKVLPKRADYAIRAMAQTRAISRAGRSAFAHVVVLMNAGLATTPAEEVPSEGFNPETGEIIEGNGHSGPAPRTKLEGPHSSKTALKAAIHELTGKVTQAQSGAEISDILKAAKETIKQAERDWPELLDGDPEIPEDDGLKGLVTRTREHLRKRVEDDGAFAMLVKSMRETETVMKLESWMFANESFIATLDGEDSRKFEAAYGVHESGIRAMDTAGA